jgi:uncharacterized protein (TIGR03086 family)
MSEAIDQWDTAADAFTATVDAVGEGQWDLPTPCAEWNVRQLVAHAVDAQRNLPRGVGAGDEIETPLGDDPKAAWRTVRAAARTAMTAPGALDKTVKMPFGEMPASQAFGIPLGDMLIHTWDIARAIGADEKLPADVVAGTYEALKPIDALLRGPGVMGPKVEPPAGADLQTEFLCFTGRTP